MPKQPFAVSWKMDAGSDGRFSVADYVVFSATLLISFGIGIYSAFAGKKKEKTTEDFYFGNHDMNIVAVAMSLAATFLSAVGLLGMPAEVYHNGITYAMIMIPQLLCGIISMVFFIPFFYNLGLTSVYEYFEYRFNRTIRRFAGLLYVTNMTLYMGIVLYAPALALSQASGLPIWASILSGGLICTIYTSLGGMKAVIWTDAFQMTVMLCGILTILINGIISAGGPAKIIEANAETGRLNVSFSPDPTVQSFWALTIGGAFVILPIHLNQATVQRCLSVKSKRAAQKMLAVQIPTALFWGCMMFSTGLIMFAYYQGCDPRMAGRIERSDQMLPVFVGDVVGYLQGLPGLFTAVVYSATLSTVSSGVNSVAVVLTEDFVKPLHYWRRRTLMREKTVMRISKIISLLIGCTAIGLAFVASFMGRGLVQFCLSIDGMCGGPMVGLFICGMMLPYCNSKGATAGVLLGLCVTFWIGIGSIVAGSPKPPLPLSTELCLTDNSTTDELSSYSMNSLYGLSENATTHILTTTLITPMLKRSLEGVDWVYGISYQWYGLIGFVVTVVTATAVSFATGRQDSSRIPDRFFLYKIYSQSTDHALSTWPTTTQGNPDPFVKTVSSGIPVTEL